MFLFFEGEIIKEDQFRLSYENRALNYGDGLFETMKYNGEKLCYLSAHLERLAAGAKAFHLKVPDILTESFLQKTVRDLSSANGLKQARVKILLWRKTGGLFSPDSQLAEFMITVKEWQGSPAEKQHVIVSSERKNYSALSGFKTLSSALYIMAGIEKSAKKADDVILLNHSGEIVECLSSNIFWGKDSQIFTPALQTGCIGGVMRKQIIERLKKETIIVWEGNYPLAEILKADFAFTSNVGGLSSICRIEESAFTKQSETFRMLQEIFS
ncbi:MAG: aminotransferase class IV [Cytophagaceae bacterium]